ncbi:MAG: adenosylmethionine--8-amino-7-oxononanoate transaminase, partial [Gammaproteobacteria bacterium]
PHINAAITKQSQQLEHVILAGFTHDPALELAEKLVEITPKGLERVFYADNGSSAVEIALKMSFHCWRNQGLPGKHKFVCLEHSYHGETLGCLSVSDVSLYKTTYEPLLLQSITAPSPDCSGLPREQWAAHSLASLQSIETILSTQHKQISAVILEPLVQCAGGMRMYDASYLTGLRALCDTYNVHLIADEIAVGFGRTGTLFACEQANISPDFLCLSKGLTAGYLPLSVVMTHNAIYDTFYDDYHTFKAFLHSHSYTGNALACTAALATLNLFERDHVITHNQTRSALLREAVEPLREHPHVSEVRQTGMIVAIDLIQDKAKRLPYAGESRIGMMVYREGLRQGVLLRPLGSVVYWMPPYVISPEEIRQLGSITAECISRATASASQHVSGARALTE